MIQLSANQEVDQEVVLSGTGITKRYPGVVALDKVDFEVRSGEVHGLIGENGAGKSTLMHIFAGTTSADEGSIQLHGKEMQFASPRDAMDRGIALVHQELNLIPYLSVAENIFLGREPVSSFGLVESQSELQQSRQLLADLDDTIDPREQVHRLRVGQQQVVELAKALNCQARVIFMDEPTSAISDQEVEMLFELIDSLRRSGVSIVYVSHKLDELFRICDRITVLRDGKLVETVEKNNTDQDTIVRLMVGRQLDELYIHSPPTDESSERLRVDSLTLHSPDSPRPLVDNVSFSAKSGEVLGIFGLMGAGRTELLEAIYGLHPHQSTGTIQIEGEAQEIKSPNQALQNGLGLVPEDRKLQGLVLGLSVGENINLANLSELEKGFLLDSRQEKEHAEDYVDKFSIRTPSVAQRVGSLSGGNQQKVVLSKVLARKPKILMLDEPTRGIDVNAKREIYALINELKLQGLAVIVVSSELPELLGISDRILVMCEGCKTAELNRSEASEEILMKSAVPGALSAE